MKYDAILFDMDGTLVPMDQHVFAKQYFTELANVICPYGIAPDVLKKGFWGGVGAMKNNDGMTTNEEVFWRYFTEVVLAENNQNQVDWDQLKEVTEDFYSNEFHKVKLYVGENPLAKRAVELAHQKAEKVILSTNPFFPLTAQLARLSWVGLGGNDFDLITSYESDSYCKPNPKYFDSICERMEIDPKNCLMIGNDELEDMHTASSVGMECFLVTDSQVLRDGYTWNGNERHIHRTN